MEHLHNGCLRGPCAKYYHISSELSVANGLLLRDIPIVIPLILRLEKLQEGQKGIEKCKRRFRDTLY